MEPQEDQNWALTPNFKTEFEQLKTQINEVHKLHSKRQEENWASQFIPLELIEKRRGLTVRWWRTQQKLGKVHLIEASPKKFFISKQELCRFMLERETGFSSNKK